MTQLMNANLHIHTRCSDGYKSVEDTFRIMADYGIDVASLTDHDSVEGNLEAEEVCKKNGIEFFHGAELTTYPSTGISEGIDSTYAMHILGYGFDLIKMQQHLERFRARKQSMLVELIDALLADGYQIDKNKLFCGGEGIKDRTSVAKELAEKGYAGDVSGAFNNILNTERYFPYSLFPFSPDQTIQAIHAAGGLAIWAHPFHLKRGGNSKLSEAQVIAFAKELTSYGLDGIEAYYLQFDEKQVDFLVRLADEMSLLKSTGSDYHGRTAREDALLFSNPDRIAEYTEQIQPLLAALRRKA